MTVDADAGVENPRVGGSDKRSASGACPPGTYLMLPILGPSDVRDGLGLVPDRFMTIDGQINSRTVQLSLTAVRVIDGRASLLAYDKAIDTAYDPYALVRNIWFQRRDNKVLGDSVPEVTLPDPDDK